MDSIDNTTRAHPGVTSRRRNLIAISFAIIAVGMFFCFILKHPVDWIQPETLRLRYYGLQAGLKEGPLSASLRKSDLVRPLVWEAQGGMVRLRYPSVLLDNLIPRLQQHLYAGWGPFLLEPVNLLFIVLTWLFLLLLIREWFGSTAAGIVGASFWLITSQTFLDAHYPIRPNMTLLTFLLVYILWEMVRIRRREADWFFWARIWLALIVAVFTHEFALNFVPLLIILFAIEWRHLRRLAVPAAITFFSTWAVYLAAMFWFFPLWSQQVVGYPPPADWRAGGLEPLLKDPLILISRIQDYVIVGIRAMISQNLGAGCKLPFAIRFIGPALALVIAFLGGKRSWRAAFPPLVLAGLYFLAIALLMFPEIPPTVEMPVYYYATIIVLFMLPLGAFLADFSARPTRNWVSVCLALLVIGALNFQQSSRVLDQMPSDFGFNDTARRYVRDVLSLPAARRAGDLITVPVYTAYPRPRVFDISRRWDIMLRVWHGNTEQVFSMLVPVLNLRLYERGYLIGDPEEFAALRPDSPGEYESRAGLYWNMPDRRLVDLLRVRAAARRSGAPLWRWRRRDPGTYPPSPRRSKISPGLFGDQPRIELPPGQWVMEVDAPAGAPDSPEKLIFLIRVDSMPPGPDDVVDRVSPRPLRGCRVAVREIDGEELLLGRQTFGWSYQLFQVTLPARSERKYELVVESEAVFEVVGPVIIPSREFVEWNYFPEEGMVFRPAAKALRIGFEDRSL